MQDRATILIIDMLEETLAAIRASDGYEEYRIHDDIFYLPEQDRAWANCLLSMYERYTGRELLPGNKDKALDSLSWIDVSDIDVRAVLDKINKENGRGRKKRKRANSGLVGNADVVCHESGRPDSSDESGARNTD